MGGISRDSQHKRRLTGGKKPKHHMKRKFEMGRQMAMTKIGAKRTREVRCRGGNMKYRALRLDTGNFSWGSEVCTRKTRVLDVVYNASNNELVRTKTLVKGAIVQVDATPFRQWYEAHYGTTVGRKQKKKTEGEEAKVEEPKSQSKSVKSKIAKRQEGRDILAPWPVRPVRRLHPRGEGARVLCQAHGEEEEVGPSPPSVARTVIS